MNVVAYCRVSTDKSDQLNSLETQKKFFQEYCERNHLNLIKTYADEGISGTKIKNRREFLCMMRDAREGGFEQVLVKDVSRLARNTVDLLQSVRSLRAIHIDTVFITANMQTMGNSEFVLTLLGAVAQEESSNTSKRIKFGKKENASRGRVPNLVYGYDKTAGDYFHLQINMEEAGIVRKIYDWYTKEGYGASKIANMLNESGSRTKRGCLWSQNAIARILKNEIYMGMIVNGKEEIDDFLTGSRRIKEESEWLVTARPELAIISEEQYQKAQSILKNRNTAFCLNKERQSNKYPFSTMLKCSDCGYSFRRLNRTHVKETRKTENCHNTYHDWVCSGRNSNGTGSCSNRTKIREEELLQQIQQYLRGLGLPEDRMKKSVINKLYQICGQRDDQENDKDQLLSRQNKLKKNRDKLMQLFMDDLISREELKERLDRINRQMEKSRRELKEIEYCTETGKQLKELLQQRFQEMDELLSLKKINNVQMKELVEKILIREDGTVDIYFHQFEKENLNL